ncbi:hypothetical protein F4779DRAFT_621380 [Xylariaceae sp. FL0662B]|nr:hypothetical protein F4779DRAFT_621380 [Xylariaceae sp. FL0662B]
MARRTTKVPDAWEDDDWEVQADKAAASAPMETSTPSPQAALSRAERLAQHAESNRRLWESAEAPPQQEAFHYLAATATTTPAIAHADFKPAVKVLSRKPAAAKKRDPATGLLSPDSDSDADEKKRAAASRLKPEEIRAKQQREREEKQRRYDEARAKIFGTGASNSAGTGGGNGGISNPSSGTSTPTPTSTSGTVTPPPRSADGRGGGGGRRGRGRGSAHAHRHNESRGGGEGGSSSNNSQQQRPGSQSAGGSGGSSRELYDPNYSPKPGFQLERRGNGNGNNDNGGAPLYRRSTPREEDQVIRAPRGPDGSGRGGFGFARRGAKAQGSG